MKIYKFPLGIVGEVVTYKGKFGKILNTGMSIGNPVVWVEVDKDNYEKKLSIVALGTGWDVDDIFEGWEYIGTLTVDGYVWHYYAHMEWLEMPKLEKEIKKLSDLLFGGVEVAKDKVEN